MNRATGALIVFVAVLATAGAQVIGAKKIPASFEEGIAERTGYKIEAVQKMLKTFGPAVTEQLLQGKTVTLPGIATIRVVRVKEYRDLVNGIPATIPASNFIEIVPTPELEQVANQPGTVPAREIEPYEFRVRPDANPGIRTDSIKVPRSRIGR